MQYSFIMPPTSNTLRGILVSASVCVCVCVCLSVCLSVRASVRNALHTVKNGQKYDLGI